MRKYKLLLIIFALLLIPIVIFAEEEKYSNAIKTANNYNTKFNTFSRYLRFSDKYGFNGSPYKDINFTKGGLLSKTEFDITMNGFATSSYSYLYEGMDYWTMTKNDGKYYVISDNPEYESIESKHNTKVTEYAKHKSKVKGIGTFDNPWIFIGKYNVIVKAGTGGKLDNKVKVEKEVYDGETVTIEITTENGYLYDNNDCGIIAKLNGSKLTLEHIDRDIECTVTFKENKYALSLPQPYREVKTKFPHKIEPCCYFSTPDPQNFFSQYNIGYFKDENYKQVLSIIKPPYREGWEFKGYYVNEIKEENRLVFGYDYKTRKSNPNLTVNFTTSKTLIKKNDKTDKIIADIAPRKYIVTFDFTGGKNGTTSLQVTYDYDIDKITAPVREGYVFLGYWTQKDGNGTQYYDGDGNSTHVWEIDEDNPKLYAHWKICTKDYYCPGDNVEHKCPIGYGTETTGTIHCNQCRYWDPCNYTTQECRYGCDWCPGQDLGGYTDYVRCMNYCAYSCSGTRCIKPGGYCNCSSCHHKETVCHGAWIYNTTCTDATVYTVNLNKQGADDTSEGTSSYTVSYYGTNPVTSVTTVSLPKKKGYIFEGYRVKSDGTGTKIIDRNIEYSTSFDSNKTYTSEQYNSLISINGLIIQKDIKSKATLNNNKYTIYINWKACEKGSYCPGNNKEYLCDVGHYQNEKGKTSCKECNAGTYSPDEGRETCLDCSKNTYQDLKGQSVCKPCATGYKSGVKATKCDPITYKVKYNANSGSGTMTDSTHTYDTAKALTANSFTKTNHDFIGWNTKEDGTGTAYTDKQSVKNLTTTDGATINLYAQWKSRSSFEFKYTGTFAYKDGNASEVTKTNASVQLKEATWQVKFLTSGTLTVTSISSNIDVFLVGGGGGAGGCGTTRGGGGGGGGYTTTQTNFSISNTSYSVTIGSGGGCGGNGGSSSAFGYTANGGGAGAAYSNGRGGNGGSGGGGNFGGNGYPSPEGAGGSNGSSGQDGRVRTYASNGNINEYNNGGSGCSTNGGCKINGSKCYNTRAFCESSGELYAGGGAGFDHEYCGVGGAGGGAGSGQSGWCVCGCPGRAVANKGGGGAQSGGSSGIVIIRNKR